MRRLRISFAVFAVALLAPVALLVERSLQSIALEKKVRQQTIAERIFDEMERALSQLLAREEQTPVATYRGPEQANLESFIVGRFEIEADSDESATRETRGLRDDPRNEARADFDQAGGDFKDDKGAPDLQEAARSYLREERKQSAKKELDAIQAPGTTVRLNDLRGGGTAPHQRVFSGKSKAAPSEYAALRSLNKAASERSSDRTASLGGALEGEEQFGAGRRARADSQPQARVLDIRQSAFGTARMTGFAVDTEHLMLFRTVVRNGALYRQGALLSIPALAAWLQEQSIGTSWLTSYASVQLFTSATAHPNAGNGPGTLYSHRFAVPFSDLTAHLTLQPLSALRSAAYVYALSVVVLAATALGLTLLYRMVALTVRFAERRSNFVAAVSHELKTPLTAIRMYGEMLRDGVVPNESKREEYYHHITNESERLSRLINNVLEYAKLEKGTRPVSFTVASVVPTMNEVAEMMRPHAAERGYELEVDATADLPAVRFEPDALKQVLWNLVDNAIKYASSASDKHIVMKAESDGAGVVVSVRDHGGGVEKRHMNEIFEPFYRGENELTRTAKGTGLGLALVQGLVDRMGATLEANNAPDGGFVVKIQFH